MCPMRGNKPGTGSRPSVPLCRPKEEPLLAGLGLTPTARLDELGNCAEA